MKMAFKYGVPNGLYDWLREHVGEGNVPISGLEDKDITDKKYAWFMKRVRTKMPHSDGAENYQYIPTITVKDEQLAVLFKLTWS